MAVTDNLIHCLFLAFGAGRRRGRLHLLLIHVNWFLIHDASVALSEFPLRPGGISQANSASGPPSTLDYRLRVIDRLQFELYRISLAVRAATKLRNWEVGRCQLQLSICPLSLFLQGL